MTKDAKADAYSKVALMALDQLGICAKQDACLPRALNVVMVSARMARTRTTAPKIATVRRTQSCSVLAECPSQFDACLEDDGCADAIACIDSCPEFGFDQCIQGCLQQAGFSLPAIQLATCVQHRVAGAGPGPDLAMNAVTVSAVLAKILITVRKTMGKKMTASKKNVVES